MNSVSSSLPIRQRVPVRFIHASDFHLDKTIEGVAEGPAHWEQRFLTISRKAAERVFQKAIDENVDFLILSGDLLNANLSPPGILLFLVEQFERLKNAGISVYWAGGEYDSPEDWPSAFPLPENVYHFPSNSIQEFYFQRPGSPAGQPLVKIVGMSRNQHRRTIRASEFPLDPGGLFTIAIANGDIEPESLSHRRIDYWALGGSSKRHVFYGNPRKKGADGKPVPLEPQDETVSTRRDRKDLPPTPYVVHYPGTPVARTPKDIGGCGATLVEIPSGEDPILTQFSTSPVRWINDQIVLTVEEDAGKLADELRLRIKNYRTQQKGDDLFINWFVDVPPGSLAMNLRRSGLTADLLSELRSLYGKEEPLTWSVSLTLLLPDSMPANLYEQQTIFGDFLRSVKHYQTNPHELIDLGGYLPKDDDQEQHELAEDLLLASKVEEESEIEPGSERESTQSIPARKKFRVVQSPAQAETQRRILREAAMLGLELLGTENSKHFSLGSRSLSNLDSENEEEEEETR